MAARLTALGTSGLPQKLHWTVPRFTRGLRQTGTPGVIGRPLTPRATRKPVTLQQGDMSFRWRGSRQGRTRSPTRPVQCMALRCRHHSSVGLRCELSSPGPCHRAQFELGYWLRAPARPLLPRTFLPHEPAGRTRGSVHHSIPTRLLRSPHSPSIAAHAVHRPASFATRKTQRPTRPPRHRNHQRSTGKPLHQILWVTCGVGSFPSVCRSATSATLYDLNP